MKKIGEYSVLVCLIILSGCASEGGVEEQSQLDEQALEEEIGDTYLEDRALLEDLELQSPDKLKVVVNYDITNVGENVTTFYYYQGYEMTEIEAPEGKEYIVYDPVERATYQYTDYSKEGIKYIDETQWVSRDDEVKDIQYFIGDTETLLSAEVGEWQGMEIIYVVTEDQGSGGEVYQNRFWIATHYAYPVKGESYFNDQLLYRMEVEEITEEIEIDESFFIPPGDILFEEIKWNQEWEKFQLEDGSVG